MATPQILLVLLTPGLRPPIILAMDPLRWRCVQLAVASADFRALAETTRHLLAAIQLARGDALGRRRGRAIQAVEADRQAALDAVQRTQRAAAAVDLPKGVRVASTLSRLERLLTGFAAAALTPNILIAGRLQIEQRLPTLARRFETLADVMRWLYVPPEGPRPSQAEIEAAVDQWIKVNGSASTRHIAGELGVSHTAVASSSAYQGAKPRPRPELDPSVDVAAVSVEDDQLQRLADEETWQEIVKAATPNERRTLSGKTPAERRVLINTFQAQKVDDTESHRPARMLQHQRRYRRISP